MKEPRITKKSFSFDALYQFVVTKLFVQVADHRASNAHYNLLDALKSGFAIYSLKCPSLFSFRQRSQAENNNLKTV